MQTQPTVSAKGISDKSDPPQVNIAVTVPTAEQASKAGKTPANLSSQNVTSTKPEVVVVFNEVEECYMTDAITPELVVATQNNAGSDYGSNAHTGTDKMPTPKIANYKA